RCSFPRRSLRFSVPHVTWHLCGQWQPNQNPDGRQCRWTHAAIPKFGDGIFASSPRRGVCAERRRGGVSPQRTTPALRATPNTVPEFSYTADSYDQHAPHNKENFRVVEEREKSLEENVCPIRTFADAGPIFPVVNFDVLTYEPCIISAFVMAPMC